MDLNHVECERKKGSGWKSSHRSHFITSRFGLRRASFKLLDMRQEKSCGQIRKAERPLYGSEGIDDERVGTDGLRSPVGA